MLLRPMVAPAAVTLAVMLCIAWYVASQNQILYEQRARADVLKEMSLVRAKLEGNINSNIQLVRGIVATLSTEPDMDQARFEDLASRLFSEASQLRNIAAAPNFVVSMVYPLSGNRQALGIDYRHNILQREAVMRAFQSGEMVLAGPVDLVQGGKGFIARFPVFTGAGDARRFWGIVSAVVDSGRLYSHSGLDDPDLAIDIAISGRDGLGRLGAQFYGDRSVFSSNPVMADVVLPSGQWVIAAVPKGGWRVSPPDGWSIWAGFSALGIVVAAPIFLAGRLIEERQQNLRALKSREAELVRVSRRLGLALETSQVGVFEYDLATNELHWDNRVNALFGLPQDGGKRGYEDWKRVLHPDDRERAEEEFRSAIQTIGQYHSEYRVRTSGGQVRNIRAIGAVYTDPDATARIVGVNWDVSADVALNESLKRANRLSELRYAELESVKAIVEHNSLHDSLTGLPNRRYLDEILQDRAQRAIGEKGSLAVFHLDLDRFKQINDTLGHAAGDAMLMHAADMLRANVAEGDFVARIGGDEFVVVPAFSDDHDTLARLAERIIDSMRKPVMYQGHECRCGVSVGIAIERAPDADADRLLMNADIALYRAKSRGRSRYEFFTAALQAEIVRTKRVADEILHGLEANEFLPYYQPQFDARTLEIVGVEALARWKHPTGGILSPARFLDVAEDLSVVATIDRIVLEAALTDMSKWRAAGLTIPRLAVNVSARRLQDEQLVASLRGLQLDPGVVSFELVESIFLDEADEMVRWNIDQIKELGIDIEIDDFGTGYASIVSLTKLKPKRLKIDRQLVAPIVTSAAQRRLVESIVEIGQSLGIEVLGEGVETLEHATILRDLGCSALQGYAFAVPLSARQLAKFAEERRWLDALMDDLPAERLCGA